MSPRRVPRRQTTRIGRTIPMLRDRRQRTMLRTPTTMLRAPTMFRVRLRDRRRRIRALPLSRIRQLSEARRARITPRLRVRQRSGVRHTRLPRRRPNRLRGLQPRTSQPSTPASRRQNAALLSRTKALHVRPHSTLLRLRLRVRPHSTPLRRHPRANLRKRSLGKEGSRDLHPEANDPLKTKSLSGSFNAALRLGHDRAPAARED